jgi:hypothetical protein
MHAKLFLASVFAFAYAATPVAAANNHSTPDNARLDKYPLKSAQLSPELQAKFGLTPKVLDTPWTGFNHYRSIDGWVLDTLPAKTLVLIDRDGVPTYKYECGNRLVAMQKCATTNGINGAATSGGDTTNPGGSASKGADGNSSAGKGRGIGGFAPGFWQRHPGFQSFFDWLLAALLFLIGLAALLGLTFLLAWLLEMLADAFRRRDPAPPAHEPVPPPAPFVAPAPRRGPNPPQPAPPAPTPAATQPESIAATTPNPTQAQTTPSDPGQGGEASTGTQPFIAIYHGKNGEVKMNYRGQKSVSHTPHANGTHTLTYQPQ